MEEMYISFWGILIAVIAIAWIMYFCIKIIYGSKFKTDTNPNATRATVTKCQKLNNKGMGVQGYLIEAQTDGNNDVVEIELCMTTRNKLISPKVGDRIAFIKNDDGTYTTDYELKNYKANTILVTIVIIVCACIFPRNLLYKIISPTQNY